MLEDTNAKATYVDPGSYTYSRNGVESNNDWLIVCPELAILAEASVNNDTHISGHSPGRLNIGGKLSEGMGSIINIPLDFQGIIRKEARIQSPKEGDFVMTEKGLNQTWRHWNESSEQLLIQAENKTGREHLGR
eukprot:844557-Heterocapsa_arctica.AAC.1